MQTRNPSVEHTAAVLRRGCVNELRYPRICAARTCRRHGRCRETGDCDPRCIASLHEIDHKRFEGLYQLVLQILHGRVPPHPSADWTQRDLEDEATEVIFDCLGELPFIRDRFIKWWSSYSEPPAPPPPPAPKIDTSAVLAEMRATLERDKIMSEIRGLR